MSRETMYASAFWRRLDTPGSDAARLFQTDAGWRLTGTAVLVHANRPARLDYDVHFHADWTTARATVQGFLGAAQLEQSFRRDSAGWSMNGTPLPNLAHVRDLDFGFTPATNLAQLRRANLKIGESLDFSVAWWEPRATSLVELPQHYQRRSESQYGYEAPTVPYQAELEIAPSGFVRHYPRLWRLETE